MGIKHLWSILTPFCERKPLYELSGKTVAVDLSCWICEAQNIAEYQVQPRMYLRTCYLLLMEVTPVFVLEGTAPEMKYDTIAARNAIQFKGAKPKTDGIKTVKGRSRFNFVLKQCEEMLSHMGLACIKGKGEAESMCAYLNNNGFVDGCISQDSDCFAYGAKVVYRNFSISTQGPYQASGGAVDIYDIRKAMESLNFGRNKIIAMALLCGSDYSDGVQGVGKESVIKFFEKLTDDETLEKIRLWREKSDLYEKMDNQVSSKNCTSCGHFGKLQMHNKNGCNPCGTTKGCDPLKFKEERLSIKNELNMRTKALRDPNFPNEKLINEYLIPKDYVSDVNLNWKQPNVVSFVHFTTKFLGWEEIYGFEKILPILTRWQCLNPTASIQNQTKRGILYPRQIKKVRNPKGIPSYEISWSDPDNCFKELIPESQFLGHDIDLDKLWSTIEPQYLVDKAYPQLVQDFRTSKIKPPKISKRKKKTNLNEIKNLLTSTSLSEPVSKKIRKGSTSKKVKKSQNKKESKSKHELDDLANSFDEMKINIPVKQLTVLDNFLKKAISNSQKQKNLKKNSISTDDCHTSTPSKNKCNNSVIDFDLSTLEDENQSDLSDIIDSIISEKPDYIKDNLNKIDQFIDNQDNTEEINSASFFTTSLVENDLFEKTFKAMEDFSDSSIEEYEIEENISPREHSYKGGNGEENDENKNNEKKQKGSSQKLEDSFCDIYIPLIERLKNKK